jgi:2-polyprenyl-3-methyl-5-hydroxy-6-metoxy-1,4-benzoquinol methylase
MNKKRNYNKELEDTKERKYAYDFDVNVMYSFQIRTFELFFKKGNMLELGSYKGIFTKKFLPYFSDITCVDVSEKAIEFAKKQLEKKVKFFRSSFETVDLPDKYDNIILTHTLEHLDNPIIVLKRINEEWLSKDGRLFLVCPNANAPSRQIAVKMGLISHNTAVTLGEKKQGHKVTYTFDTLEKDVVEAGLEVVYRSGIFFKPLANFQWDKLSKTDIISPQYLEGCYKLGQQYPDLCSSIFLLCKKGK